MTTTVSALKEIMMAIGMDKELVQGIAADQLLAQQGVDSLDYPAFAMAVEKQYKVMITDADSLRLKTLNDFVTFIAKAG